MTGEEKKSAMRAAAALFVMAAAVAALVLWQPSGLYLWLKAIHVIAVIAWMAGMLYLPRLFVYHAPPSRARSIPKPSRSWSAGFSPSSSIRR